MMEFLGLKGAPQSGGKGGDFYLPPGAPLEHVMEALDGGGGGDAFYAKGAAKCAPPPAPYRDPPARDGAGECPGSGPKGWRVCRGWKRSCSGKLSGEPYSRVGLHANPLLFWIAPDGPIQQEPPARCAPERPFWAWKAAVA